MPRKNHESDPTRRALSVYAADLTIEEATDLHARVAPFGEASRFGIQERVLLWDPVDEAVIDRRIADLKGDLKGDPTPPIRRALAHFEPWNLFRLLRTLDGEDFTPRLADLRGHADSSKRDARRRVGLWLRCRRLRLDLEGLAHQGFSRPDHSRLSHEGDGSRRDILLKTEEELLVSAARHVHAHRSREALVRRARAGGDRDKEAVEMRDRVLAAFLDVGFGPSSVATMILASRAWLTPAQQAGKAPVKQGRAPNRQQEELDRLTTRLKRAKRRIKKQGIVAARGSVAVSR